MQLRISSQMARLGLNISKPEIQLHTTMPQIQMQSTPPRLEIDSTPPRILIDQSQCFADENLRGIADFASYCSNLSRSKFQENVERTVRQGNSLAAIEGGYTIADIGIEAMSEENQFGIVLMPKQPPKIVADVQPVRYEFTPGEVSTRLNRGQVDNQFQWGSVQAYLTQMNHLNIEWVNDSKVNIQV